MPRLYQIALLLVTVSTLSSCAAKNTANPYVISNTSNSLGIASSALAIANSSAAMTCEQLLIAKGRVPAGAGIELVDSSAGVATPVSSSSSPTSYIIMSVTIFRLSCAQVGVTL